MTQRTEELSRAPVLEPKKKERAAGYDRFIRFGIAAWAGIGILLLAWLLLRVLGFARPTVAPLLIALVVVYLLNPIVTALERRGTPRVAGAAVVYLLFIALVALVLSVIAPLIGRQVAAVADDFPAYVADAQDQVRRLGERFGQRWEPNLDADRVSQWLSETGNRQTVTRYLTGLRSFTTSLLHALVVLVLGPIMAFYLLVDLPRLQRGALAMIPPRSRDDMRELGDDIGRTVGGFFRGQLLVALFVGIASSVGLYLIHLPFWLLVGIVAGLFNLVPLIGPFIGGGLAVVIALLSGKPVTALLAVVVLTVVQQIDNHLISPNVMGRTVRLHPVVVMLALLLGATVGGLFGMLVVVPLVGVAKIVFLFCWARFVDYGADLVEGTAAAEHAGGPERPSG
jgi:predicted PurR-regulated permease PerM